MELFKPDKIIHLVIFGILSWLILKALGQGQSQNMQYSSKIIVLIFLSGTIFGFITEGLQYLLPVGRHANVYDSLADSIGALLGIILFMSFRRKRDKTA